MNPLFPDMDDLEAGRRYSEIQARHAAGLAEMGALCESDGSWYLREERDGLILDPPARSASRPATWTVLTRIRPARRSRG